eukprot:EC784505.1.p1 GENE.EC784505.1~~EC784505.1.p1  ORF type:complete len:101 (+),score=17.04 EC784505.1:29-331(+)
MTNCMILSKGRTMYFGPTGSLSGYLTSAGYPEPPETNPADFAMDMVNTGFPKHADLEALASNFTDGPEKTRLDREVRAVQSTQEPLVSDREVHRGVGWMK